MRIEETNEASLGDSSQAGSRLSFTASLHRLISELQRTFIAEGAASRE